MLVRMWWMVGIPVGVTFADGCRSRFEVSGSAALLLAFLASACDTTTCTFTEWQSFQLEETTTSWEDCCNTYSAKPLSVVVPEAARLDANSSQGGAASE